ncbi:hypothetical protein Scep_020113 [Stephania cephalantha]|uniref:Serine/threonine-protein kinase ATR n=1 Tax=Stephania cephalantha TaxID=152367 RepID=A0AAP0IC07_9MAGN
MWDPLYKVASLERPIKFETEDGHRERERERGREGNAMANLSSLVHELRERIAASSSASTPINGGDEQLEMRFRTVLPNLLQAYVIPSSSANEREVIAILKLVSHTARNFPGVFFNGRASAVLPVVGRVLPFFAEPAFRARHGVIFETVWSLLCYYYGWGIGRLIVNSSWMQCWLLKLCESVGGSSWMFCRPLWGILVRRAKQLFLWDCSVAAAVLFALFINKDLLYIASKHADKSSTVSARVSLKCFRESFAGISAESVNFGELPECCRPTDGFGVLINLTDEVRWQPFATWTIKILTKFISEGMLYVEGFVNASFVSAACSLLCYGDADLHMACFDFSRIVEAVIDADVVPSENIIRSITTILGNNEKRLSRNAVYDSSIGACLQALHSTCSDSVVEFTAGDIINVFPKALQSTNSHELKVALCSAYTRISKTCPPYIWRPETLFNMLLLSEACTPLVDCLQVAIGVLGPDHFGVKEIDGACMGGSTSSSKQNDRLKIGEKRPAYGGKTFQNKRQKTMKELSHPDNQVYMKPELTCTYARERHEEYLDFTHGLVASFVDLLKPGDFQGNSLRSEVALMALSMLCLAFVNYPQMSMSHCIFQQMHSWMSWIYEQLGFGMKTESVLEIIDLALHDESDDVRGEAVVSMPMIVLSAGFGFITQLFEKLELLITDKWNEVHTIIPLTIGYLTCLYGTFDVIDTASSCKLFIKKASRSQYQTLELLSEGFWCSKCDSRVVYDDKEHDKIIYPTVMQSPNSATSQHFDTIQSLFLKLLYEGTSEEVQVACVRSIRRLLMHGNKDVLFKKRCQWIQCIEFLLINKKKSVREAFCGQISCFIEGPVFNCLFGNEEKSHKTKEQKFLDILKHAIAAAEDPEMLNTLLEATAEIMNAVDIHGQLFFYSLMLLVDQLDNPHMTVRMAASSFIKRSCYIHLKAGLDILLSKVVPIKNELYDYLCMRLVSRSAMVKEFAEAVLGVQMEEFVKKMVPVVLPKLVISQQDNDQAFLTLQELAKHMDEDTMHLIVTFLPKVLAFALLRADGRELSSALQFYQAQTGSDNKEIFGAALPALLDELVCFLDDNDADERNERLTRVPQMIQEVARILTSSDDLPGFLRNHFVGLLNSIDRKMLHSEDLTLQKQALKRIEMLIGMMDSHLGTYVPKIMVLLMHALDKENLQVEALSVLNFFIKQLVNVSPSSTKHVISQVFAALIPFLERQKENPSFHLNKVVEILEELVVENRFLLEQHIRELPLLPSIPVLTEVNKVIQEARGSMTFKDRLLDVVDGLNHESLNVRYMVACELSKLLNLRADVTAMITGETCSDLDVLSSLIMSLLRGCSEESRTAVGQRLKLVCADCLGALGAVDPAKVKVNLCQRLKIECSDDDLIFELMHKHLARAFRAAPDMIVQDSAAVAIQELLKLAGCQASLDETVAAAAPLSLKEKELLKVARAGTGSVGDCDELNRRGRRLWDRFSNYVKEIIAPCLTSRFQLPNVGDSTSLGPIYRPSMSFRRWIFQWIRKLTVHSTGSRATIFNSCRAIVRHDMQTAMYLLPYLVLNAVCHGTVEARNGITEEILTVLNAAASGNTEVTGIIGGQNEVCIQAIFTLLDNLGQWVDDVKQELAVSQSLQSTVSKQQASKRTVQTTDHPTSADLLPTQSGNVSELLAAIPKVTLARASFRCQAYARALLYFESHLFTKSGSFNPAAERSGTFEDDDVTFLMEIYSGLDEPDGLSGFANLRKSSSLQDQLLINKKAGNWAEVLTSCEQSLQMEPTSVQRHSDVLDCLLNMCHLQAMVTHVDGLISRIPQYKKTWCMHGVQAAWRLGRWDLMDEYIRGADEEGLLCSTSESYTSFDMDVAKILQAMMKKDKFSVLEKLAHSRQSLLAPLAAAGMDSYARAYPFAVKLHMLRELEDFHNLLVDDSFLERTFHPDDLRFSEVVKDWDNRLKFTQTSLWAREPLLSFRRLVFGASDLGAYVGNCWLQYAKLCRSAGHYETANRAILEAQSSGAPNVHMEKAKLLWSTRRSDGAIAELQQSLLNMPVDVVGSAVVSSLSSLLLPPANPPSYCDTQASNENRNIAKVLLLYSRWIHCTGQKQKEDVMTLYSRVRELQPKWEKGYFYMAKYCDDVLVDARKRQEVNLESRSRAEPSVSAASANSSTEEKSWVSYLPDVLLFYAKGLHRGHKNLFQALPRLLTLWFDFGSKYHVEGLSSKKEFKQVHQRVKFFSILIYIVIYISKKNIFRIMQVMSIMRGCLKDLPKYQWLTVLPQLVSRICHHNEETVRLVKLIITSVLQEYPQQALWIMAAVSKSIVPARREAAAEIINAARKGRHHGTDGSNLFVQFATLIDHLIRLCFHAGQPKARTINISTEFSALKRMMPLGIIMPVQQALTVSLPVCDTNLTEANKLDIFSATNLATISGIADEAEILSSLQRPKKVVFIGSDGIERPFLCKPKDDLRKDARMMEFVSMINRLLSKYPESRRRKLYIRTFAVIPLTEDCGMVEWVPHTRGLRHILQDIYIAHGKFDRQKTNPLIKRIYDQCQSKMPADEMLKTKILPMFPPIFHKWFLTTFSEPAAWFRARIAYAHTTSVWSMVGHIVGLGDRHGENILFDSTTGDCVHVDFSCLFDKGLQLEKPELVPFRLTQNMIDGLGIAGYEGVFLRVCEITLSVLRGHRETLMSVLETFIHDPLVEWTKSHKSSGVEVRNPHAQRAIGNIEARLQGVVVGVGAAPSLPLAVEGQARRLIAEALCSYSSPGLAHEQVRLDLLQHWTERNT